MTTRYVFLRPAAARGMRLAGFALLAAVLGLPAQAQAPSAEITVAPSVRHSTTQPLRDMAPVPFTYRNPAPFVVPERFPYRFDSQPAPEMRPDLIDPVLDNAPVATRRGGGVTATLESEFEGIGVNGSAPPDPTGEIGPNHFVQMVNSRLAVYDRTGTLLLGPVNNNQLWSGAGGACEANNDGDPIVLYDESADRWLVSQFSSGPDAICVAISTSPDPTGSYYLYEFSWPEGFPDYPKFGVWPTGYALTTSTFPSGGGAFSQAVMLERDEMLAGNAAQSIRATITGEYYSMLPADFDGPPPPAGTPALFAGLRLSSSSASNREAIRLYALTPDWTTPANSTFSSLGSLPVAPFDVYALFNRANGVPQAGTSDRLAGLGHRPMMRLQYRNQGSHGMLLFNHTIAVNDGPTTRTGVRWYELRDTGTGWGIHQQGTFAPSDGHFRWVGSMAMNDDGTIGVGYSVASSSLFASMRFAGQSPAASGTGVLDIPEIEVYTGTGAQTGTANRWGDYSHLSVDPADGSTFWYTNLYYQTTSSFNWKTRIAEISVPSPSTDFTIATAGAYVLSPPQAGITPADLAAQNLVIGIPDFNPSRPANFRTTYDGTKFWFAPTSSTDPLPLGMGFQWILTGIDRDYGSGSVSRPFPTTLSAPTPNTADVTVPLQTNGFRVNIYGNPFGVPLDITAVPSWPDGTKVGFVWLWDVATKRWLYDAGVTQVEPWQAFFIRTRPGRTGTLTIPASAAIGSAAWSEAQASKAPVATPGHLRFDLDGTALDGAPLSDGALAVVVGDDLMSEAKLTPLSNAYVAAGFSGGAALGAIAALDADGGSVELPIAVTTVGAREDLVLRWEAPTGLPTGWTLTLVDRRTGATADLSAAGRYAFTAPSAPALAAVPTDLSELSSVDAEERFVLRIDAGGAAAGPSADVALASPFPNPTAERADVPFTLGAAGPARLSVFDALGREVAVLAEGDLAEGDHTATFDARGLAAGLYVIRLSAGGEVLTQRATVVR